MTTKVSYIATDGTEFDDVNQCFKYENDLKAAENGFDEITPIEPTMFTSKGELTNDFDYASFVFIQNYEEEYWFVSELYKDKGTNKAWVTHTFGTQEEYKNTIITEKRRCAPFFPTLYRWNEETESEYIDITYMLDGLDVVYDEIRNLL